jgi:hypothetical protein
MENGFDPAVGTSGKFMMLKAGHNELYVGVVGTGALIRNNKRSEWHSIDFVEPGSFEKLLDICRT